MRKYRKHAIVVIPITAGVVTPSSDMTSQLLVVFALYMLYQLSIFVSLYKMQKRNLLLE